MIVLEVKNLKKKFGKSLAINDVSFQLESGKIIGLIGPNGAGKTTTLKCITGLLNKTEGTITILGLDIREMKARSHIAYIPETPDIYPMLTVWEHMKFIALAYDLDDWKNDAY